MMFYHGTSEENWKKIQQEGILWGGYFWHKSNGKDGYRHTYLTPYLRVAQAYGNIILSVEYNPVGGYGIDNYEFSPAPGNMGRITRQQLVVFVPIPISKVKKYG